MNQLVNESINYKGVCRTAPATPGLLNILDKTGWVDRVQTLADFSGRPPLIFRAYFV